MTVTKNGATVSVTPINEKVFRINRFFGDTPPKKVSFCIPEHEPFNNFNKAKNKITTDSFTSSVDEKTLAVTVNDKSGSVIYSEKSAKLKKIKYTPMKECIPDEAKDGYNENSIEYTVNFNFDKNEHIYGLGCFYRDKLDLKKETVDLIQFNTFLPLPFMVSSKNYGVFFDHYSYMRYNGKSKTPFMHVSNCECADYYVICGESANDVTELYYSLVGKPRLLPKSVFGYIQSKERYKTQDELVEIARRYDVARSAHYNV